MLEIKGVYKTFNPGTINEKKALNGIDLTLNKGDFVTVIGGNGAGKSTILNMITGVYPVDCGTITIDGVDVTKLPEHKRAKFLGRVFQDPMTGTAADMEIEENLALAARRGKPRTLRNGVTKKEKEQFKELLKMLDLGLENRLTSKVGLLSGGQRQAITLLMATMQNPKLLLLDEPAAGMNPQETDELTAFIGQIRDQFGLTVFLIEHHMDLVMDISDRIYVLDFGKLIAQGTPAEIQNNQHVIDAYLGVAEDA